jgi:hypothetical protein
MKSHTVVAKATLRRRAATGTIGVGWRVDSFPTQGGDVRGEVREMCGESKARACAWVACVHLPDQTGGGRGE